MFNPDGIRRITFADIREHPIFRAHFPTIDHQSKILYNNKKKGLNRYDSFVQERLSKVQPKGQFQGEPENIEPNFIAKIGKTKEEKEVLEFELEKIKFLF